MVNQTSLKLETSLEKKKENERTRHRLRENIARNLCDKDMYPKNIIRAQNLIIRKQPD